MKSILLWAMPGVPEMLIILVVILVIFGGKKGSTYGAGGRY